VYRRCSEVSDNDWSIEMWCMLKEYADSGSFQAARRCRKRLRDGEDGIETASDSEDDESLKRSLPSADRKSILSRAALLVGK
jgi:hypothetical protein